MNFGKFSVKNPVLVNILMIAIIVLGTLSLIRLPREIFSDIAFSWAFIAVPYPGVSAEEIEKNVAIKIEEEIKDVDRIRKINSVCRQGICFVQVAFDDEISKADFQRAYQDLRTEFDKVTLPDGTLDPWVEDFSSSDFMPMLTLNLKGNVDATVLNETARDLKDRILDINNISKVEIVGGQKREIWVEINRDKLDAFGISINEVADAIKYRNINIPGGTLESETQNYLLQVIGEIKNAKHFGEVIVRSRPGQGTIKVSDVATINEGFANSRYDVRYDGETAISLFISKSLKGNSIQIVQEIKKIVKDFESTLPEGITIHPFNDTSIIIQDIIRVLSKNSVIGFFILILVLFIFIGFRNSLITALGIPITFAVTFMFMEWYGESLNGNSLFALVMVLGMIVDHAIVIIENSYRHHQLGLSLEESAIKGTNEVVKPVIAGSLTTIAAFLPFMLLPGIMGKFMRIIPIVTTLALLASTMEALIFLPVHFAEWGSKSKGLTEQFFTKFQSKFRKVLERLYRHRYLTLLGAMGLLIVAIISTPLIRQDLFAGEEFSQFMIDIDLPLGTPRSATNTVCNRFEERILPLVGNGEVSSITATVGFKVTDEDWLTQNNYAQITVDITELNEGRKRPVNAIIEEVKEMCKDIPGAENVKYRKISNGPPVDKPITFRLQGDNYDDMASIADDYKQFLAHYPELYNIDDNFDRAIPELQITINEERAASLGLNVGLIGMCIRNSFDGITATTFFEEDDEIDVIIKFAEASRSSIEDVKQMKIPTMDGRLIPFSTVCTLTRGKGIANIKREDRKREITIFADADDKRNIRTINTEIEKVFNEKYKEAYPDVTLNMEGEFAEFNKVITDILRLLGVGLFLMYIILGAQFKSFVQPFIMGATIFFAAIGCILFLVVSQTPFSVVVMFAGGALTGICVNDSIVLISFINSLRRSGKSILDSVIEGSVTRLRPIILTSVTTIAGLMPMALGIGGRSDTWAPMALTMIFGLFFSTMGTLLVIPCMYGMMDDMSAKLGFTMKLEGE